MPSLQDEFRDNLEHIRLIRKDGTTIPVSFLIQREVLKARQEEHNFVAGMSFALAAVGERRIAQTLVDGLKERKKKW